MTYRAKQEAGNFPGREKQFSSHFHVTMTSALYSRPICFDRGMNSLRCSMYLMLYLILCLSMIHSTMACWGISAPRFGDMTRDFDLEVGSELVLNCSLNDKVLPGISRLVNASDLVIEKGDQDFSRLTHPINELTTQLRISRTSHSDSGTYFCKLRELNGTKYVVCNSRVTIGYPPKNVTNFRCIDRNFENLTCTWNTERNGVHTKYSVVKYYEILSTLLVHVCPTDTANDTSCQWRKEDTEPPNYVPSTGNIHFNVSGNNSLGRSLQTFSFHPFEIVIPNSPTNFIAVDVGKQYVAIRWDPPDMKIGANKPSLQYEIWVQSKQNSSAKQEFFVGNEVQNFTIQNLIPYTWYNISLRCRSVNASGEDMWSPVTSIFRKTAADVPYFAPEVIPEAFELHQYENSRSVTLYWKSVPKTHHNGENFHYYVQYFEDKQYGNSNFSFINSSSPSVRIENLLQDSAYSFHVHTANKEGISYDFKVITVDKQENIPAGPKDIRAISQDLGHYNLSWTQPGSSEERSYVVFWCSSLKPWKSRCDSEIYWLNNSISENSVRLNLSDFFKNFQFAVVTKSGNRSSGMQWASCIVPHKAALGKIPYLVVEQKNSSSLKVIWRLDCSAQKTVVDRYEIRYCRLHENEECKAATVLQPNAENYLLENLHPYSNYSIKIRAFTKENMASEDSEAKYQSTLEGAPSDPPRNVEVTSKTNTSFHATWLPPLETNGQITKYFVIYNGSNQGLPVDPSQNQVEVKGLKPFTNYSVEIKACVKNFCSEKSRPLVIRTNVGEPGQMERPSVDIVNSTHFNVSWTAPTQANGPIDFYVIQWYQDGENDTVHPHEQKRINESLSTLIGLKCSKLGDGGIKYLFSVRAVNMEGQTMLYGPFSQPTQATACMVSQGLAMIIGIAIGGTLALAFFLLMIYKLIKWMSEKIHQVKSITIRLPKGLEGPETNPLNNYESFKHGLAQNTQLNKSDRLSYIVNENDNKNRHGSGSSQYSNSSTDELIFKNSKCTKFGRKPSGDSSGCSSMSSNTTPRTHLSSDSGTESDFMVPPSPESVMTEQSLHNTHKLTLPILVEDHDQLTSEKPPITNLPSGLNNQDKYSNLSSGMILKVEHPYSKFGISGNTSSSVPWRVNPLAFYSCNLANSEPSVFDAHIIEKQNSATNFAPYSKLGLAKSSGDILGISFMNRDIGYSKFGFSAPLDSAMKCTELTSVAMAMTGSPLKKEWPDIKNLLENKKANGDKMENPSDSYVSVSQVSQDSNEDCGYVKVGVTNCPSKGLSQGYVPFGDIQSMRDRGPTSPVANLCEDKDGYKSSAPQTPAKEQAELSDGDTEWTNDGYGSPEKNCVNSYMVNGDSTNHQLFENGGDSLEMNSQPCIISDIYEPNAHGLDYLELQANSLPEESVINFCNPSLQSFSQINCNGHKPFYLSNPETDLSNCAALQCDTNYSSSCSETPEELYAPEVEDSTQPEVLLTPLTMKNGYVPFSTLSNPLCDKAVSSGLNDSQSKVPLSIFPGDICTEIDHNYVTPSNKGDLRLLQGNSKNNTVHCNGKETVNDSMLPSKSGVGYINGSLKYVLKPLPKMESEICEV